MVNLLYNNSNHFTTVNSDKNLCTLDWIAHLNHLATSRTETIYVEGSTHSNYHSSGVLFDSVAKTPLFVRDTYIRISLADNRKKFIHVLVAPPNITDVGMTNRYFYYNEAFISGACHAPPIIVPPTFGANL